MERNDLCPGHADGFENILPYLGIEKKLHRKRMRSEQWIKSNICCLLNKTEGESFPTKIKQLRKRGKVLY